MSEIKVNKISQRSGTAITLGNSGTDFQLPSGADIVAQSGSTITIAAGATITNSGTASGFGPTGAVNWNTTKITANPNPAVSGVGYFCDTSSAAFTVTLPAAPSAGAIVALSDYTGTFATNNLTVGRNGSNIRGSATDLILNVNNQTVTLIYVDGTEGWNVVQESNNINNFVVATGGTILTCGDYKTHVFTGPGTFTVTSAGNPTGSNSIEYLVVAGGGGGGLGDVTGGGGAGGYRQNYPSPTTTGIPVTVQNYPITVGAGGAITTTPNTNGNPGNPSIFSTITSAGGGGGAGVTNAAGLSGGSGGGGAHGPTGGSGGSGNTPPTSPSQGNNGGNGSSGPQSPIYGGGGGGGASAVGTNGSASVVSPGGVGSSIATAFFGPTSPSYGTTGPAPGRYFAGGGGGGRNDTGTGGLGGSGGGGNGGSSNQPAVNGTTNTGGGGGGTDEIPGTSSAGGSGIVVIRYKYQ